MSAAWAAAFAFAVRVLGLRPEDFWRLSVAEWRALTGTDTAPGRSELTALMARFPDAGEADGVSQGPPLAS